MELPRCNRLTTLIPPSTWPLSSVRQAGSSPPACLDPKSPTCIGSMAVIPPPYSLSFRPCAPMLLAGSTLRLGLSAALRPVVTGSGCTVCLQRMASPTNRRQIASYVGITPMPYQSGGMDRDRRISRAGNPRARTTMIQLAWLSLRYQPGSERAEWFRKRVGTLAGHTRRIAIVALARKLLIALWLYVETGVVPAGVEIRTETIVAA